MKYCFPCSSQIAARSIASVIILWALHSLAHAQPLPEWKLTPGRTLPDEDFGAAVAIDGNVAIIGAFRDKDDLLRAGEQGAAYVFRYDGVEWVLEAKLTAPQRTNLAWFGWSVSIDRDVAIVGTRSDDGIPLGSGAVYVFRHDGSSWVQEDRLTASDAASGDHFGRSLAVNGDMVLVGSANHDAQQGAAYLYRRIAGQWVEEAKLKASDAGPDAYFGESVALSGTRALVGAWRDRPQDGGPLAGAAYVFDYDDGNGWRESAKLTADTPAPGAQFGASVALDGDVAVIGAPLDNELGGGAGAAYVFRFDGDLWAEESKLLASDNSGFNLFGGSVAVDGTRVLVGAHNWAAPGEDGTGKAYFFSYDADQAEWTEVAGLVPADGATGDRFGYAVALAGDVMLVGSPDHGEEGRAGAAYAYGEPTGVSTADHPPESSFELAPAFPNPFQERTQLSLVLDRAEHVRVAVFDVLGREITTIYEGLLAPQTPHILAVEGAAWPSGLYFIRVRAEGTTLTRRVILRR